VQGRRGGRQGASGSLHAAPCRQVPHRLALANTAQCVTSAAMTLVCRQLFRYLRHSSSLRYCYIWCFDSGEDSYCGLPGYDTV
jgi:hypothetical protein